MTRFHADRPALRPGRAFAVAVTAATALRTLIVLVTAPAIAGLVAIIAFPIALFHAVVVGLPAYLLLERVWPLRWWSAVLGGAAVAASPFTALSIGQATTDLPATVGCLATIGAVAGLAFWWSSRPGALIERDEA